MSELQSDRERVQRFLDEDSCVENLIGSASECGGLALAIGALLNDYLQLTDQTPITEQGLRELKPIEIGSGPNHVRFEFPGLTAQVVVDSGKCRCKTNGGFVPWDLSPRTMGEFTQLLRRVNGDAL